MTEREQALELLRELLEVCIDRGCEIPGNLRVGINAALADHAALQDDNGSGLEPGCGDLRTELLDAMKRVQHLIPTENLQEYERVLHFRFHSHD